MVLCLFPHLSMQLNSTQLNDDEDDCDDDEKNIKEDKKHVSRKIERKSDLKNIYIDRDARTYISRQNSCNFFFFVFGIKIEKSSFQSKCYKWTETTLYKMCTVNFTITRCVCMLCEYHGIFFCCVFSRKFGRGQTG